MNATFHPRSRLASGATVLAVASFLVAATTATLALAQTRATIADERRTRAESALVPKPVAMPPRGVTTNRNAQGDDRQQQIASQILGLIGEFQQGDGSFPPNAGLAAPTLAQASAIAAVPTNCTLSLIQVVGGAKPINIPVCSGTCAAGQVCKKITVSDPSSPEQGVYCGCQAPIGPGPLPTPPAPGPCHLEYMISATGQESWGCAGGCPEGENCQLKVSDPIQIGPLTIQVYWCECVAMPAPPGPSLMQRPGAPLPAQATRALGAVEQRPTWEEITRRVRQGGINRVVADHATGQPIGAFGPGQPPRDGQTFGTRGQSSDPWINLAKEVQKGGKTRVFVDSATGKPIGAFGPGDAPNRVIYDPRSGTQIFPPSQRP